jgi:putative ABC transport system permease protein
MSRVDREFFTTFEVPRLAGRTFQPGDRTAAAGAVVVNRSFVRDVMGDGNPLGRRIRYVGASGDAPEDLELERWFEIVGVVGDFPDHGIEPQQAAAKVYHAVTASLADPLTVAVRLRGTTPAAFADRLRDLTTALDPALRPDRVLPLSQAYENRQQAMRMAALAFLLVVGSILLLSAAGLYTLMSFTVVQRTREIGIRAALGASTSGILGSIFARALRQLAAGIALGVLAAIGLDRLDPDLLAGRGVVLWPAVSALMLFVGLLAALGPARRGLGVQPTEALNAQG